MTGEQWYEQIMGDAPELEKVLRGKTIWIHTPTGRFTIGELSVALALAEGIARDKGRKSEQVSAEFFSRAIGWLDRV